MRETVLRPAVTVALALLWAGVAGTTSPRTPVCGYEIVAVYPHDPTAYTQGLAVHDGVMFEGTGLYGDSSLRRLDLATGTVQQQHDLAPTLFGEGIAVVGDRIFQLTWRELTGFVYDRTSFSVLDTFSYAGEGWGLTFDGHHLIHSDGTSTLEIRDPATFGLVRSVEVFDDQGPVDRLNELEYIVGEILANRWLTDYIARIDLATGQVTAWIDLSGLLASQGGAPGADVLNGIAWDADAQRLFVTGKRWPWLFEIELPDCPIGLIFGDGFESGSLTSWSSPEQVR